jgi:membrane fusion protein (multidrug efflux system)
VLTTVSQVSPIKVYFSITEREYLQMTQGGRASDWVHKTNATPLELTLATGEVYKEKGHILFADRQVNSQTGTILLVASFANPGGVLRPGQFGHVRAMTGVAKDALLVPQRSVSELQGHYQVAVVGSDNRVSVRNVEVGERVGPLWIVQGGVKAGERVVTEGVSKIRDGVTVQPQLAKVSPEGA